MIQLNKLSTRAPKSIDKEEVKLENAVITEKIAQLQRLLYAEAKHSLLIIFQGMDASGKDGAVRRLFSGVNPAGVNVVSWKKPTDKEFAHDFLWRIHQQVPEKGMIQVFNRSHYEDILVPAVNGYIDKKIINKRYKHINNFEALLEDNHTHILKFYLHTSKEEQLERLQERITIPEKHWKHNDGDWDTREQWDEYRKVYQQIFEKCNDIPWHVIPSDQNWYKVNQIGKVVLHTLERLKMKWPLLETERFE